MIGYFVVLIGWGTAAAWLLREECSRRREVLWACDYIFSGYPHVDLFLTLLTAALEHGGKARSRRGVSERPVTVVKGVQAARALLLPPVGIFPQPFCDGGSL